MAMPAEVSPDMGNAALRALATPKSVTSAWAPCVRMFAGLMPRDYTPLMRKGQRIDAAVQDAHDLPHSRDPFALEPRPQGLALDERHGIPQQVSLFSRCEHEVSHWVMRKEISVVPLGPPPISTHQAQWAPKNSAIT
jgi:hypothetical protein